MASFTNPVSAGIAVGTDLLKIGLAQLAAHTARLKGAKTENAGVTPVVEAFDADVATIVSAYNNGQTDAATAAQAARVVANNIKANLQANVGAPGTAWSDSTGMTGKCDKTCTAGCCVYYGDLGPVLSLISFALGGGTIIPQWGAGDPRYHQTALGATIDVPEVFASKYGGTDRPGYSITLTKPPITSAVGTSIKQTVDELLGLSPSGAGGAVAQLAGGPAPARNKTLLIAAGLAAVLAVGLLAKR